MQGTLETIRKSPFTLFIAGFAIFGFVTFQPSDIARFEAFLPVKLILGSLLHVHTQHLSLNLALWVIAGCYLEPLMGSKRFALISGVAVFVGGLLETLFVDPQFVGLSAACYGVVGAIIWKYFAQSKGSKGLVQGGAFLMAVAAMDTVINLVASPDQIAYAAHIGGLMAGFLSSLGFGKSGTANEPHRVFRPMTDADVKPILEIIYDHDEDDGEEAEDAFEQTLADKYVMEFEGRLMGMTGFRPDPDSPHTAWLSFTYIHDYFREKGNAYWMMLELRNVLDAAGIKRLFIATSDYVDEETGEDIYLAARNFYEHKLNAEPELRVDGFYAPNESKYIYSLPVSAFVDENSTPPAIPAGNTARFVGLDEAPESDTSYVVLWEEMTPDDTEPKSKLPTKSFPEMIEDVKSYSGKALFLTLPDYISNNHVSELKVAGFTELGQLNDYFAVGISEIYWGYYFD